MGISFADSFQELLRRVLDRCVLHAARPSTYRRDQVEQWVRRRLARSSP